MRRFLVEHIPPQGKTLIIRGAEARHIRRVLRMGPGARILLMDGKGRRCEAIIESGDRLEVQVRTEKILQPPAPSPIEITICQALLKSQSMDFVIQKTSELGIHSIQPFSSMRTVVRMEREKAQGRLKRWRDIAASAAKQSDRPRPAEICEPCSFEELLTLSRKGHGLKMILYEEEKARDLKGLLRSNPEAERIIAMVGPEGGFSPDEVTAAVEAGFLPVSLGRRILRAETASLTLAAILQYEWGDLSKKA